MNEKELAEKVAEKLGWKRLNDLLHGGIDLSNDNFVRQILGPHYADDFEVWKVFRLMVEKAEEMGYCLRIWDTTISFMLDCSQDKRDRLPTHTYSWKEHAHIKACCLAFIEIPDK